ncbi:SDR family NAD(P)-dependent oxidoreductase [Pseudomaricurvus alcaniphilus]|uniref:SDR family NAD(P)-dependent oxidoreductase n=1 Tax=Pseudomaricurvus alcaniphilus TaxID=1166482 RepID=UPI0014083701|nr:SDR family NAD(P)-dependent oxidoreductase [Pseudomaricurvus alcaniphilus]NHN36955.1 SDR family NAD(P)-dependent oxidoreductase [Pseudomaricurvus alcaniphilus]
MITGTDPSTHTEPADVAPTATAQTRVALIGASGGIGAALLARLRDRDNTRVYAFSRSRLEPQPGNVSCHPIAITDEHSIRAAAAIASADGPLDLVIVATGILHSEGLKPEKSLRDIDLDNLTRVFTINSFAPALLLKHFLPAMQPQRGSVFAALSARVGSIGDNRLGGWYAYRASKAALNMLLKTASLEMQRLRRPVTVVGLHPGTVATDLSAPFQKNVAPEKLFSADFSAQRLLSVIDQLQPADSGKVFAWDGAEVPC